MSNHGDETGENPIQQQIQGMQKLMETQLQMLQLQVQQSSRSGLSLDTATGSNTTRSMAMPISFVKNVKVPEGRYDMNSYDFRTFCKDCCDYKKFSQYSGEQVCAASTNAHGF